MDLDELQTVQSRERQTDSLQQLRDSFYAEASEYIQQLRDARDDAAERADDPWDNPEVNRLSDEIKTAEQTVEAIYDRRVGKIVKKASLAAADMPTEEDGLTDEERDLFDRLVTAIEESREHVLDMIAGDVAPGTSPVGDDSGSAASTSDAASPPSTADSPSPPSTAESAPSESPAAQESTVPDDPASPPAATPSDSGVSAADVMDPDSGSTQPEEPEPTETAPSSKASSESESTPTEQTNSGQSTTDSVDRETVRITRDVGAILGVDQREYDLSTDDVVTLPADNAEPLVQRDAAQRLD